MTHYRIYQKLFAHHGPQNWWPADSPFEVMVGAVLTQNTSWTNVEKAIANLVDNQVLDCEALIAMSHKRLAKLLTPVGYFNVKATRLKHFCAWYAEQGGYNSLNTLPTNELRSALLAVHGIGPETADDILLYAFEREVFVIDAYTRRLFQRLGMIDGDEGYETLRSWFEQGLRRCKDRLELFNEYHALIVRHAKHPCRARNPDCPTCQLREGCAFEQRR